MNSKIRKIIKVALLIIIMGLLFVGCEKKQNIKTIMPLYTPVDMKNLPDGIYRVTFTDENITEDNKDVFVKAEIYSEDIFDTVDIHDMKAGDKIFYSGSETLIEEIHWDEQKSSVCINFPSYAEAEEDFRPNESGGTYYISGPDGHHTYTLRGVAELKLNDNFVLTDSSEWGEEPIRVTKEKFKTHVINSNPTFYWYLNTYLRIEDGEVIEMTRHYIP